MEATGQVRFSPPRSIPKVWEHAYDFLADWVQHIPRARQHQVTYAGHFANALGNLNPKQESQVEQLAEKTRPGKWVKWRTLILRTWAVDPELCPRCQKEMKRAKALIQQHGLYPTRPRSPPPPCLGHDLEESQFSDPSVKARSRPTGTTGKRPDQASAQPGYWPEPLLTPHLPVHD